MTFKFNEKSICSFKYFCVVLLLLPCLAFASTREKTGGASDVECGGVSQGDTPRNCYLSKDDIRSFTVKSTYDGICAREVKMQTSGACTSVNESKKQGLGCNSQEISNKAVTFTANSEGQTCTITLKAIKTGGEKTWTETWHLKKSQTITGSDLPATMVYDDTFSVSASASSGLPVTIAASGGCSGGGTGSATIRATSGTETCTVQYTQGGNYKYNAAATVTKTGATQKAEQVLEVQSPIFVNPLDKFQSPANVVSAQAIAYTGGTHHGVHVDASGAGCSTSGDSPLQVGSTGLGECTLTFTSKADPNNYVSKTEVVEFEFVPSAQEIEITQPAPAEVYALDEFTVSAIADSGEPVSIEVSGDGCEAASTDSGTLTIQTKEAGKTCFIYYSRDEVPPEYEAAIPREQWVTTIKQQQGIVVNQPTHGSPNSVITVEAELLNDKSEGGADISISTNNGCQIEAQSNDGITGAITAEIKLVNSGFCHIYYDTPETAKFVGASAQGKTKIVIKNNSADVGNIWAPSVLAYAKDDHGKAQPITAAPMVSRSGKINSGGYPNVVVMFGSGQYMYEEDLTDQNMQSLYVVHDRGEHNIIRSDVATDGETQYSKLEKREFSYHTVNGEVHRKVKGDKGNTEGVFGEVSAAESVNWSAQYGWYVDLDAANLLEGEGSERSVFRPIVVGDVLMLSTIIPQLEMSCASETKGVFISMDWTSGLATKTPSYDVNGDGALDSFDAGFVGSVSSSLSQVSYFNESALFSKDNEIVITKLDSTSSSSDRGYRVGWEEKRAHGSITE